MPITARVGTAETELDKVASDPGPRRALLKLRSMLPRNTEWHPSEWMVSNTDNFVRLLRPSMTEEKRSYYVENLYGTGPGALFVEGVLGEVENTSNPEGAMPIGTRVLPVWLADP